MLRTCELEEPPKACQEAEDKCSQIIGKSTRYQFYLKECNEKLPEKRLEFYFKACLSSFGPKCLPRVACKIISSYVDECKKVGVSENVLASWKQLFDCREYLRHYSYH